MAKLTKAQRQTLQEALRRLEQAHAYIMGSDVVVANVCKVATTTLHLTREASGAGPAMILYPVAKDIGSHLCGLGDGIRRLRGILEA